MTEIEMREVEEQRRANAINRRRFLTDVSYVKILLEGIYKLNQYGMGTSHEAIQKLIDSLEFSYDPIYRVLNENYDLMRANASQKWLNSEFGNLRSMDINSLIACVNDGRLQKLLIACNVVVGTFNR